MEVSGQHHTLAAVPRGKNPGTPWIGGWVGHRDALDVLEKSLFLLPRCEPRSVKPVAWSIYRLSYPGSQRHKGGKWAKVIDYVSCLSDHVFDAIEQAYWAVRQGRAARRRQGRLACHLQPASQPASHSSSVAAPLHVQLWTAQEGHGAYPGKYRLYRYQEQRESGVDLEVSDQIR